MMTLVRDAFVVGMFTGLMISMLALCALGKPKPSTCEVSMGVGKETHVRYGVVIGDM